MNPNELQQARSANEVAALLFPQLASLPAFVEREVLADPPYPEVLDLNDDFWALTLGSLSNPEHPTVFLAPEFKRYSKGLYETVSEASVISELLMNLDLCLDFLPKRVRIDPLLRNRQRMKGIVERARDVLKVDAEFFLAQPYSLPVQNGNLDISTSTLHPFSPSTPLLETLKVKYDPEAKCDLFLHSFLNRVLSSEDVDLLQRYCSQILEGVNYSQSILLLTGDAGWGKSSLMKILGRFMEWKNVGIIRQQIFSSEFELSHYLQKKLLYCPDMPTDFLDCKEASLFKQLVGGDPLWADVRGWDAMMTLEGNYPIILACNGKPRVYLDEDADAWLRRLVVLSFKKAEDDLHFGKMAELILKQESSGILNWLLEGRQKLVKDKLQLLQTEGQKERSACLLMSSESPKAFVRSCLRRKAGNIIWMKDIYAQYQKWCGRQSLRPFLSFDFMKIVKDEIEAGYGMKPRHDLKAESGKARRGWSGIAFRCDKEVEMESLLSA